LEGVITARDGRAIRKVGKRAADRGRGGILDHRCRPARRQLAIRAGENKLGAILNGYSAGNYFRGLALQPKAIGRIRFEGKKALNC
jgi:hypothetical protein